METRIIGWDEVDLAVDALKKGEAICFPTETVYGIGILSSKKDISWSMYPSLPLIG